MDVSNIKFFDLANKKMEWLATRQQTLTENMANSDTPGYRAQETESFESFLGGTRKVNMTKTNPMHLSGHRAGDVTIKDDENAWETSPNGNTVSVEQQTIKSSKNAGDYQMVMKLYKKSFSLLGLAGSDKSR
jgi:flagellar basal-body rod protein FlgB